MEEKIVELNINKKTTMRLLWLSTYYNTHNSSGELLCVGTFAKMLLEDAIAKLWEAYAPPQEKAKEISTIHHAEVKE